MSAISWVRASIRGAFLFAALTASLALAFSFAVAGPPTASELSALQVAGRAALRETSVVLKAWGHGVCANLNHARRDAEPTQPQAAGATADAQDPAAPVVPPNAPLPQQTAGSPSSDVILLGGEDALGDEPQPTVQQAIPGVAAPPADQVSRVQRAWSPPAPARSHSPTSAAPRAASIADVPEAGAARVASAPPQARRAAAPAADSIAALMARVAVLLASPPPPVVMPHAVAPPAPELRVAVEPAQDEQTQEDAPGVDDRAETDEAVDEQQAPGDDGSPSDHDVDDPRDYYSRDYYSRDGYRRRHWRRRSWNN